MSHKPDKTEETRAVLNGRAVAVARLFAGEAGFDEVLAYHADDFVWLSTTGACVGIEEARQAMARRLAMLPPEALVGTRVLRTEVAGEYGFVVFKTAEVPFGCDTYRVVDGKVAFQSNGLYLPSRLRPRGKPAV